jgi:NitT/TauT family transport system ATP-binding protein
MPHERDGPVVGEPFVEIRNLSKTYTSGDSPICALSDISITINEGEFLTVLGPSGCGKSTLLKCVAGLEAASAGEVRIGAKVVTAPPSGLGVVFQRDILLDWRCILDNVLITAEFLGLPKREFAPRARQLLAIFGLSGYEHRYPWELSGGMRQRVAICRALLDDPRLLLMDEPFGALDALTRDDLNIELQQLWMADRKTVLFITHSISEAVFLSDTVLVMERNPGRIAAEFRIDLLRPRRFADRDTPAFNAFCSEIRGKITGPGYRQPAALESTSIKRVPTTATKRREIPLP